MFHCLVIKVCCVCLSDSSFILSHLFLFVKHFFKFFSNIFELRFCCRFVDDLDTLSYLLSLVNKEFLFSEILFNCLLFKNNYSRQLSYITIGYYLPVYYLLYICFFISFFAECATPVAFSMR